MCELNTAYFTQKKCAAPSCWPGSHGRRSIMHTYERSLRRVTLPRLVLAGKEWGNVSSTRSTPQRLHYTNTVSDRSGVSSGGGNFDIQGILFLVSVHFDFLFKILVTRSLKTVNYLCYLTVYERFRHFFGFIEIARFWWVSVKKCNRPFLIIIKFTTKVGRTGVSKFNSQLVNDRQSLKMSFFSLLNKILKIAEGLQNSCITSFYQCKTARQSPKIYIKYYRCY